ncbi:MAG TPA: SDR family NAD(P)-dependent oxidoreductase [Armatimonadota bacterium]|nr:SDR family NAD(P)-dependent oxidoreductase [Armatimonadota bacterium]
MRLSGKVALVTGGASGIGRATAVRLAGEGAAVGVVDVAEAEGIATVEAIRASGGQATFVRCDVTREDEVRAAVTSVHAAYGALHVLVCSAGILHGAYQHVEELELAVFERVLDVNLLGTFLFSKHAAPRIEESGGGVILCIASVAGVRGPSSSLAYSASKGGVQGLCYTLERNLAPRGIRVNVVCPATIDTALKRRNIVEGALAHGHDPEEALATARLGDPDGVAKVLAFLASDDAEYLVGTVFTK